MSSTTSSHRRGLLRKPQRRTALGGLAIVTAAGLALTGPIMGAFAASYGHGEGPDLADRQGQPHQHR